MCYSVFNRINLSCSIQSLCPFACGHETKSRSWMAILMPACSLSLRPAPPRGFSGFRNGDNGRTTPARRMPVTLAFLIGIRTNGSTMWESWRRWKTAGFILSRKTPTMPASRTVILWKITGFMDMEF